eukprot:CAMPEP_0197680102 /NCGR_PEP_ID=MMETSP1338-20131121/92769_1 /TAXON_ID=43686 ORGANISM="Pelagodinium beii, Strain RCC1491" /NCGR_SAMPLE_ID=MMETSP1338 /ASSEMBLY_ACC=CAM_ASM_000754 /LENGTH=449 /DNA_ID=CAMNT_0043261241 /DNA_START=9 /DNA_END=1355 /DNA_ORIENTATION=+
MRDAAPAKAPNVLADAVYFPGDADAKKKALLRHVIVKDLSKVAKQLNHEVPTVGIFANKEGIKAPMAMYAIFDGMAGAGTSGPQSAEHCVKNFHTALLSCITEPHMATAQSVQEALVKSLIGLDMQLLANPEVEDGCGAAIALLVGDYLFIALLGRCSALLCAVDDDGQKSPVAFSGGKGTLQTSLGDRSQKAKKTAVCLPLVHMVVLKGAEKNPWCLLQSFAVQAAISAADFLTIAEGFPLQPRAFCGETVARASEKAAMAGTIPEYSGTMAPCTLLQIHFLPDPAAAEAAAPAAKKPKLSESSASKKPNSQILSMRLRHILVKFHEGPKPPEDPKAPWASRSRTEAEKMLRKAIAEIRDDKKDWTKTPKDLTEMILMSSKKFCELVKRLSDCQTAKKGPPATGELGWLTQEDRAKMGGNFGEVCDILQPGSWSDICASKQGVHLVQR